MADSARLSPVYILLPPDLLLLDVQMPRLDGWREMASEPEQYFKLVNENSGRRLASRALTKKPTSRSVA